MKIREFSPRSYKNNKVTRKKQKVLAKIQAATDESENIHGGTKRDFFVCF